MSGEKLPQLIVAESAADADKIEAVLIGCQCLQYGEDMPTAIFTGRDVVMFGAGTGEAIHAAGPERFRVCRDSIPDEFTIEWVTAPGRLVLYASAAQAPTGGDPPGIPPESPPPTPDAADPITQGGGSQPV